MTKGRPRAGTPARRAYNKAPKMPSAPGTVKLGNGSVVGTKAGRRSHKNPTTKKGKVARAAMRKAVHGKSSIKTTAPKKPGGY